MANTVTMGGVTLPLADAILLSAYATDATQYQTLYRNGAGYQVPVGYKLILVAVRGIQHSNADPYSIKHIGYGDNVVGSTTAPTNAVDMPVGGATALTAQTGYAHLISWYNTGASRGTPIPAVEIPAGKYPYFRSGNTTGMVVQFLGYLAVA